MRLFGRMLVAATLVVFVAPTAHAQGSRSFMDRWFWSLEAGATFYRTNFSSPAADASGSDYTVAPTFGINWYITATKVALQLSFEETLFTKVAESVVEDPSSATGTRIVRSDELRRFGATVIALPIDGPVQPFAGLGFVIQQAAGLRPRGAGALSDAELQQALETADSFGSNASLTFLAGINYFVNRRWVVYGQYRVTAGGDDFLLAKSLHTLGGGIRLNFGSSKESIDSRF